VAGEVLIDRRFLERLEQLTIHWTKSFPGLVGGHSASRFAGPGQEFLDHRIFHHGDDLRAVNWRAFLRLEKLFLKMFRVEPRVPVRLLLDVSRSMSLGDPPKFDYARRLAAALSYVAMVRLDTISIHPFHSSLGEVFLCSGGRHRFGPVANYLEQLAATGETDFFQVARQFSMRYAQRGLAIVISDFLGGGEVDKPLQYLAEFGHELLLLHVWSPEDREPPWSGELTLHDAETGEHIEIDFDSESRDSYIRAFDEYAAQLQKLAYRHGGRYVGLETSVPVEDAIFGPIAMVEGVR
jgi:uncharacterized protein (DUF58 family)